MAKFDEPLHSLGERLQVPSFATRQALAWWVAADLVRRHPSQLRIIEAYPHQYGMAVTLVRRLPESLEFGWAAYLTLGPSFHLVTLKGGGFNWLEVLLARDRREYVVLQLEADLELSPPRATPSTTSSSIGPRLISAFLARTSLGPSRWIMRCGATDSDDGSEVERALFAAMPHVAEARGEFEASQHPLGLAESRFWFLCPLDLEDNPADPVLAIDCFDGRIWNSNVSGELLLPWFDRVGRKIDALVSVTFPPAF